MLSRKTRVGLIISLTSLLVSILLLEAVLRIADPTGVLAYQGDLTILLNHAIPDEHRGYVLSPGDYVLSNSAVRIEQDLVRAVPDTDFNAGCSIAAVGDSATFGHGVNDSDTWVNRLAQQFPDVRFINAGVNGYNSDNIRATLDVTKADGYIYLLTGNDAEKPIIWQPSWQTAEPSSGVSTLARVIFYRNRAYDNKWVAFEEDLDAFAEIDTLLMFAIDGDGLTEWAVTRYPQVVVIPNWTHDNSPGDKHPNAIGHMELAEHMQPYIDALVAEVC